MKKDLTRIVLFVIFIVEIILFKLFSTSIYVSYLDWLLISTNIIYIGFFLLFGRKEDEKKYNFIIFISFIIRNVVLFLDIHGMTVGFTGDDTERFYLSALGQSIFTHNYSTLLKFFIAIIGDSRIVLQYINVLCSLFSILLIKKILQIICHDKDKILLCLCIFSFAPANILLTCSLLRESIMIFLNVLSLYSFIKWFTKQNKIYFILSILCIFFSSWLHSGMLVLLFAYAIAYIIYNHKLEKLCFRRNSIFSLIFMILLTIALYIMFGSSVTSYFTRLQSIEALTVKNTIGNTDYLTFINNVTSIPLLILYTPLKIIYFYFSPMIWDCYSVGTLLVFLFSSSIYIFLLLNIIRGKSDNKALFILLMIGFLCLSIVYGWGTGNAGTAMRHREKILPFIIIMYSLINTKRGSKI